MTDFTSSLYLGMMHGSRELPEWRQLTSGVPAALKESVLSKKIAGKISEMQGLRAGLLAPSTLHLYIDLFRQLSEKRITLFVDIQIYPVSLYGIEQIVLRKIPVIRYRHLDATDLELKIRKFLKGSTLPVIITDGWCPQCGKASPVDVYLKIVQKYNGMLVMDDSQALGVLGKTDSQLHYGKGGGGLLKWMHVTDERIVSVTSLAKGFGVPVAAISGSKVFIRDFESRSKIRMVSSPVNFAVLSAVIHTLNINQASGDAGRKKLWENVNYFRRQFNETGIPISGGIFPVQTIYSLSQENCFQLHQYLNRREIHTVIVAPHMDHNPGLSIIINANHTSKEIDHLIRGIADYSVQIRHHRFSKEIISYAYN